jgi:PAS domain-containing protein
LIGTFGISRDITERRHAEQAFRESEDRLTLALESLNLGTWDLDLAADRAQCSPKLLQLYGCPGESMDAARWQSNIHPDDRQSARLNSTRACGTESL